MERNDYDSLWKEIIAHLFEDFLLFFAPDLYEQVDFTKEHTFLEQELRKVFTDSATGKCYTDKLAKVYLKNGEEQWILVHIEVQGDRDDDFTDRMFRYFYRVLDKYNRKIYAISIFTDSSPSYKPNKYKYDFFGTQLVYTFNTYKIKEQNEEELIRSSNPFALVILAGLYALEGRKLSQKYNFKKKLIHLLFENSWHRRHMHHLLIFIDTIIKLPENESKEIYEDIRPFLYKEEKDMGLSLEDTSFAKFAREEGREKGIKEGIREGIREGIKKVALNLLKDGASISYIAKVTDLSIEQVQEIEKEMQEK